MSKIDTNHFGFITTTYSHRRVSNSTDCIVSSHLTSSRSQSQSAAPSPLPPTIKGFPNRKTSPSQTTQQNPIQSNHLSTSKPRSFVASRKALYQSNCLTRTPTCPDTGANQHFHQAEPHPSPLFSRTHGILNVVTKIRINNVYQGGGVKMWVLFTCISCFCSMNKLLIYFVRGVLGLCWCWCWCLIRSARRMDQATIRVRYFN